MAESDTQKMLIPAVLPSVSTGDACPQDQLYPKLSGCFKNADSIDIIVAFLMESGVRILMKDLKAAVDRGVRIRILTGNYLGITQPSALYLIRRELGDRVELKFYNEKNRSFHPKSYIFHYGDQGEIFIGSSNISFSALSSGIEWNYSFPSFQDPASFERYCKTFDDLFDNHSVLVDEKELREYSKTWHRPAAIRDLSLYDSSERSITENISFEPRGAQIEALCALENTRAEGADKALIMAATGIGKTYLAAFDSIGYDSVLFVAHREEILKQAADAFKNVRGSGNYGFFNGGEKCTDRPVIFASVQTLGRKEYLSEKYFPKNYFRYIVIDEFHHAVNRMYQNIIDYFEPDFLLGLTATPDRMDGRSIYELCDYNVPYEIDLKEGINKGMLCPFHYYGIYDDTDYSDLSLKAGRYDENELNLKYIGNKERYDLIYNYYTKYGSRRALGFCCSRAHAEEMAAEFSRRGIPSAAVYSNADGEYSADRTEAIEKLKREEIRVIFSVDMFNEGVDITSVDMVMFLRPTESPVVFMQQLGRGLRISDDKEYLNVLDFIGNYEKAGRVRFLLTGRNAAERVYDYSLTKDYPDRCLIDFDMRLIDLFREMDRKNLKVKDVILGEYRRIKDLLGHTPGRMDLFTHMEDSIYRLAVSHSKDNPFRNYLGFLKDHNELTEEEEKLYDTVGREFLNVLETTDMSKVYKMPVLDTFYNNGNICMNVTEEELLESWKRFFDANGNWKDLGKDMTYESYKAVSDRAHVRKIIQMPVHFLQESGKGFFVKNEEYALSLRDELADVTSLEPFIYHMNDIIRYRTMDYYFRRYESGK